MIRRSVCSPEEGDASMHKFAVLCTLVALVGCASKPALTPSVSNTAETLRPTAAESAAANDATIAGLEAATIELAGAAVAQFSDAFVPQAESAESVDLAEVAQSTDSLKEPVRPEPVMRPEPIAEPNLQSTIDLDAVIDSVYRAYPLLEAAVQQRTIALGEQMQALGEFDLKVTAASENQPTGFYETYRQRVGFVQPRYEGGNFFGGYRIGRGNFEPWYKERETNDGGEFRVGLAVPLARDRRIDERRAALWRANAGRRLADPDINAQLIGFVQEAGYAYWNWVAAGEKFQIAEDILKLAEERTEGIRRQVEEDALDPPVLTDNLRLIADRRAALAAARQQLRLASVRLSLYLRGPDGRPFIPDDAMLPKFPPPVRITPEAMASDIDIAINQRPEIAVLAFMRQQLEIDFSQASNEFQPSIDAVLGASQDVGTPATPLNDKGQFEADASVYLDVPVQRRKARGKMQSTQGKIAQVAAKRRLTEDKVVADVQAAYAALIAAYEQVEQMRQSVEFAEDLAARERRSLELGLGDLLTVALREQFAVEAAGGLVDALRIYYLAQADYRAALAEDQLP